MTGLGATVGGILLAQRGAVEGLTGIVAVLIFVFGLALIAFTATGIFWIALVSVFAAGAAMVINGVGEQTLVQASVDPAMRGRVMSRYGMISRVGPAVGAMTIEVLFVIAVLGGTNTAFNSPLRMAVIPSLVDRDSLGPAVAINSLVFNIARIGVPALAGLAWLARRGGIEGLTRVTIGFILALGVAVLAYTATDIFPIAIVCVFFAGMALIVVSIAEQTLIQASVGRAYARPGDEPLRHARARRAGLRRTCHGNGVVLGRAALAGRRRRRDRPWAAGVGLSQALGARRGAGGRTQALVPWTGPRKPHTTAAMDSSTGFAAIVAALRIRDFAIFIYGSLPPYFGTWLQRVATGWLVWELTESGTWLGIIAFAELFPTVFLSPLAGVVADRIDRLVILRFGQAVVAVNSALLCGLTLAGLMTVEILGVLVLVSGLNAAFNWPVRLAIVPSLVNRANLSAAIALTAVIFNLARVGGPAIAGIIIVNWGVAPAFAVNSFTHLIFLVTLFWIRLTPEDDSAKRQPAQGVGRQIAQGYGYVARHGGIGPMMVILVVASVFLRPYIELFPGFAAEVFGRGAGGLAWLTGVTGLGATFGSVWLAQRGAIEGLTRVLVATVLAFSLSLLAFTATRPLSLGADRRLPRGRLHDRGGRRRADLDPGGGGVGDAGPGDEPIRYDLARRPGGRRARHGNALGLGRAALAGGRRRRDRFRALGVGQKARARNRRVPRNRAKTLFMSPRALARTLDRAAQTEYHPGPWPTRPVMARS